MGTGKKKEKKKADKRTKKNPQNLHPALGQRRVHVEPAEPGANCCVVSASATCSRSVSNTDMNQSIPAGQRVTL